MKYGHKTSLLCLLSAGVLVAPAETNSSPTKALASKSELPGKAFNLRAFIACALATGQQKIVIPPGRYRVQPSGGSHLQFQDLQNVEIIAEKVEMVCGATVQAIGFDRCTNVTFRGLTRMALS